MGKFTDWLQKREGADVSLSIPDEEGDGGDQVANMMEKPGAFPAFGDDLPITAKNRVNKMRKCNCRQDKK